MAPPALKKVIVVGASGTIGTPIVAALLENGTFDISALSRHESTATFPTAVIVRKADLTSTAELVKAFEGQDVVICTMNDAAAGLQAQIIEAAFEAGVKRFIPSEWGSHEMTIPGTLLEDVKAQKHAVVELLNSKVKEAKSAGNEFHWTGLNNGTFFDWALHAAFIDITLPPTKTATIWDSGSNITTFTNLSTVAAAVVSILTIAETQTRDRLVNIESFAASQNEIVAAFEKAASAKWTIRTTTTKEQLALAHEELDNGEFLPAFYRWIRAVVFSEQGKLPNIENGLLGLPREDLRTTIRRILAGEKV